MRILFAGSPAIAVPSLEALAELECLGKDVFLAGVLTNPDSKRGRHGREEPTDISAAARKIDARRKEGGLSPLPQLKPEKLNAKVREEVAALAPDLLVSFACGYIFGPRFLSLFPMGGINVHPSLLPKYRGASPVPAVILAGEKETGICVQTLSPEVDAGDILVSERFDLSGRETAASLYDLTGRRAAVLLKKLFGDFGGFAAAARPQEGEASYCGQIQKEDGRIDWRLPAARIDARIRAYTPWPLSYTSRGKDLLFILEARPMGPRPDSAAPGTVMEINKDHGILIQTGDGILAVTRLQWQAKKALDFKSFCNGTRDFAGAKLGEL